MSESVLGGATEDDEHEQSRQQLTGKVELELGYIVDAMTAEIISPLFAVPCSF